ncbi:hypothetical protein [Syntrophotalea acetylenica]|uniref:Uncharacterized protein n=1 Tax=Syntrophotalea acetylenica TaxID=29542 RepID=A0A1L3GDK1_SYNAC|nr:hypothetical protein [Syntrophotalea acetylenica]APG23977.1 hypothetical protein A7E75_02280 [Syntrophotalea acetylenica]APG44559.1 hypothetical protein A6070_10900 [Syntrophotalea acetylenica]
MSVNQPTTQALLTLAWHIWSGDGSPAQVDDAGTRAELEPAVRAGILLEDEKRYRFANESPYIEAVVQYIFQAEGPLLTSAPKTCFEELNEIYKKEIGKKERVSGRVLARLHNSEKIDAYDWGRQAIIAGVRVFTVLHVMEGAVNNFDTARPESILQFFAGHYDNVKNDLAGGMIFSNLRPWFAEHPDIARKVILRHESNPDEKCHGLYACSLHGLSATEFSGAFELLESASHSPNIWISRPAVHVMGLVDYTDPSRSAALNKAVQICSEIIRTNDHQLLGTAVRTLCNLVFLSENDIVSMLDEVGKRAEPEALLALSDFLLREEKSVETKEWFWPMFLYLVSAKAEHKGILENIDMVLDGWVAVSEKTPRVIEFLNRWISKQPMHVFKEDGLEEYYSATMHGLANKPDILTRVITEWLLHDDTRYPLVAQKLLSRFLAESPTLELDHAIIGQLRDEDIQFLLRRILGYVIGYKAEIQLVFSLVRTRDAEIRTFGYVASVLLDQVGYNYPSQTIEYLKAQQIDENESDQIKALCGQVIADLQAGLDALDNLPDLKEFHPSSLKRRHFVKERRRQMDEAIEEASKNSIFYRLATRIPLKAGVRSFQTIEGKYTDPMELKGMSHSIPLPRSVISDPAGAERDRLLFRRAKRDKK